MTEQSELARKLKAHIDTLDGEIRRLDAKLKVVEAETRQRIERSINDLWAQRGEAESRLDEVKRTSESAWSELRTGFERAFDEIYSGFKRARERAAQDDDGPPPPAGGPTSGTTTDRS